MTANPVLTISLLCSGRPETEKCLNSLASLREKVPCELILVDTGCDAKMKQLLSRYADEVVLFVWCDNFSRARNAGVERARGEWFLYLDDDEAFPDTRAIEDFFLSGEYKNYGYAVYAVRNFFDEERDEYQDAPVARLYSLKEGGKFQGKVHENFSPRKGPVKILNCIAEHTGYIFRTPEEKERHALRNIGLLKSAIEEEKGNGADGIHLRAHLAQEYHAGEDYKKLLTLCKETLYLYEKQTEEEINRHRGCFYCGKILSEMRLEDEEAAFLDYKKAVSDKRNTGYTTAYLMTQGAELFWKRGEKEKIDACCRRYLELWEYYKDKPEKLFTEQTFFVINAFYDEVRSRMYSYKICLDLERKNTESLKKYFDDFGWEKDVVYMTEEFMLCLVKTVASLPYEGIFVHAAEVLANKPGMDNFWEEVDKAEKKSAVRQLVRIFSETAEGNIGKAAVKLREMLQAEKDDDWESFSVSLKEAVSICPRLGGILKRYAKIFAETRMIKSGMQALAAQVKAQLPVLLSQGMKKEALQVVEQLQSLVPGDEELEELARAVKCVQ